ncbi:Ig-like domain-containing protein [Gehongia tenuis]|uniref:Ig-like domain-containing protein n=1 Tax=Gehongia tenuis TaxID=2763655 RepID=A0A926D212_9FIRM|nr:Ig-like domain-containing protein [Gehongia tenuis]MBC8530950.1 Ig-like domain-containing protein [Gehongia tenuis]
MKSSFRIFVTAVLVLAMLAAMSGAVLAEGEPAVNSTTGAGYNTIQDAIDSASPNDEIVIAPGSYAESLTIDKSLVLRSGGEGKVNLAGTMTITGGQVTLEGFSCEFTSTSSTQTSIVRIAGTSGQQVTFRNSTITQYGNLHGLWTNVPNAVITLDNTTVSAPNGAYPDTAQAITLHPLAAGITLNVVNGSKVTAPKYYAITSWAENAVINVTDSTLIGWAAIYLKTNAAGSAHNTTVNLTRSTLNGECPHGFGSSNGFSTIVLEGVSGCDLNMDAASTITAKGNANLQGVVTLNNGAGNNSADLKGTLVVGTVDTTPAFFFGDSSAGNEIILSETTRLQQNAGAAILLKDENSQAVNVFTHLEVAVNQAGDGDTLVLQGTCPLNNELVIDKALTIDGNKGGIEGSVKITHTGASIQNCDLSAAAVTVNADGANLSNNFWGDSPKPDNAVVYPIYTSGDMTDTTLQDQPPLTISAVPEKTMGDAPFTLEVIGGLDSIATEFSSSNPAVATVDSTGRVTLVGPGSAEITATKPATTLYNPVTARVTVTVKPAAVPTPSAGTPSPGSTPGSTLAPAPTASPAPGATPAAVTDIPSTGRSDEALFGVLFAVLVLGAFTLLAVKRHAR